MDCRTCDRPDTHCPVCPINDQPDLLEPAAFYLRLWNRCDRFKTLPRPGGLLEQDERTMRMLDVVAATVQRWEKAKRNAEGHA